MNICIICKEQKPLTEEHIIPEFLGGGLTATNVCSNCNSKMGAYFEGPLSNSILFMVGRYGHNIEGKSKDIPFPFKGVYYDNISGKKFQVNKDSSLTAISEINIKSDNNSLSLNVSVDEKNIDIFTTRCQGLPSAATSTRMTNQNQ